MAEDPLFMTTHEVRGLHSSAPKVGTGRLKLLFILLVCAAPVIASYLTYYVIKPQNANSYGVLISEQPDIPDIRAIDLAGREHSMKELANQWLLVSVGPAACDADCEWRLYLQRQIREAMGPDRARIDWVWLVTDEAPIRGELLPALQQGVAWRVDAEALSRWLKPAEGQRLQDHLYVVDPLGNWMMRFPAQPDPDGIRKDIRKLLKASQFWDTEGRQQ